ncbi:MAG: ThiF family adenylyltransferase, partial [Methylococcaceae bacterium]
NDTLDNVHYASIVLSQTDYSARLWERTEEKSVAHIAEIKTQTVLENCPSADSLGNVCSVESEELQKGFLARSTLALGVDTLRKITQNQQIAIIGVGGLGSVIAENLIHSGFQSLCLVDPDVVEITNLNRIVGAYFTDAQQKRLKIDVVKEHLQRINPNAKIKGFSTGVEDAALLPALMSCDWVIVATDNHFSRFTAQEIALRLGIPLISTGVNITVDKQQITDMSGEVIIARYGDKLCLNCLGRINPTQIAAEQYKGKFIGDELVKRGYVSGQEVKEPAVKTLNAMLGAMTVDILLNQYTQRQAHQAITVYENNRHSCIYPDTQSVVARQHDCFYC